MHICAFNGRSVYSNLCLNKIQVNRFIINTLNAESNLICHLLTLLGAHYILHISRIRVNVVINQNNLTLAGPCILIQFK
jgi:hypothetical protein